MFIITYIAPVADYILIKCINNSIVAWVSYSKYWPQFGQYFNYYRFFIPKYIGNSFLRELSDKVEELNVKK